MCLAVFDAVLVHVLRAVAPHTWQVARRHIRREGGCGTFGRVGRPLSERGLGAGARRGGGV